MDLKENKKKNTVTFNCGSCEEPATCYFWLFFLFAVCITWLVVVTPEADTKNYGYTQN